MRPRVLLSISSRGWCFENIARQIERRLADRFDFSVRTLADVDGGAQFDLAVSFFWHESPRLRARLAPGVPVALCLYDHLTWSSPSDGAMLERETRQARLLIAGSPLLAAAAAPVVHCPIEVCQDGVDLQMFPLLIRPREFRLGWCGNATIRGGDHKGTALIEEAARRLGVELVTQSYEARIPQAQMADRFYRQISAYACASLSEGTPNPVLEALACGRPVITTRVGITDQMVQDGRNGFFMERNADAVTEALAKVRDLVVSPEKCRQAVDPQHSWGTAIERWVRALERALS